MSFLKIGENAYELLLSAEDMVDVVSKDNQSSSTVGGSCRQVAECTVNLKIPREAAKKIRAIIGSVYRHPLGSIATSYAAGLVSIPFELMPRIEYGQEVDTAPDFDDLQSAIDDVESRGDFEYSFSTVLPVDTQFYVIVYADALMMRFDIVTSKYFEDNVMEQNCAILGQFYARDTENAYTLDSDLDFFSSVTVDANWVSYVDVTVSGNFREINSNQCGQRKGISYVDAKNVYIDLLSEMFYMSQEYVGERMDKEPLVSHLYGLHQDYGTFAIVDVTESSVMNMFGPQGRAFGWILYGEFTIRHYVGDISYPFACNIGKIPKTFDVVLDNDHWTLYGPLDDTYVGEDEIGTNPHYFFSWESRKELSVKKRTQASLGLE